MIEPSALTNLRAHLELTPAAGAGAEDLQRDIACLIASYATVIPAESSDPEDADDCPFRELRLMTYSRSTGACSLNTGVKPVPPELLGYAIAKAHVSGERWPRTCDVTLREAASRDGGPGRSL